MKERTIRSNIRRGIYRPPGGPMVKRVTKTEVILMDGRRYSKRTGERADHHRGGAPFRDCAAS